MIIRVVVGQDGDPVGAEAGRRREMVPAMFIFGDSLIDNGNNNNLPSFAKANYYPYGIDFNGGPTGRFSNGYTMVDEIGNLISLFILVYFQCKSTFFIYIPCFHLPMSNLFFFCLINNMNVDFEIAFYKNMIVIKDEVFMKRLIINFPCLTLFFFKLKKFRKYLLGYNIIIIA